MQKIRMPSLQTIIDTAISEIIVNGIWYFLSRFASIQSPARDWGFVALSVIVIIMVGWYLGKRVSRRQGKNQPVSEEVSQVQISDEQKELLNYYERQKENWRSNLSLRIMRVTPTIEGDVPKVRFQMEMVNYLPVEIRLVKVIHSSGSVSASALGSCELPALPETIEERIPACSERDFPLQMEVGKTNAPNFLRPKLMEPGRVLQWTLWGEWYVEIDGETKLWQYKGVAIMYNQVVERQQ